MKRCSTRSRRPNAIVSSATSPAPSCDLGVYSAARDAYLVLSATAQEQYIALGGDAEPDGDLVANRRARLLFEQYRRQLVDQRLPPLLATAYRAQSSDVGYHRFGDVDQGAQFISNARSRWPRSTASTSICSRRKRHCSQLDAPPATSSSASAASARLEEVAGAIRELREAVGVA